MRVSISHRAWITASHACLNLQLLCKMPCRNIYRVGCLTSGHRYWSSQCWLLVHWNITDKFPGLWSYANLNYNANTICPFIKPNNVRSIDFCNYLFNREYWPSLISWGIQSWWSRGLPITLAIKLSTFYNFIQKAILRNKNTAPWSHDINVARSICLFYDLHSFWSTIKPDILSNKSQGSLQAATQNSYNRIGM